MKHSKNMTRTSDPIADDYLTWYKRTSSPGVPHNPFSLAGSARDQWTNRPALAKAFERCTLQWNKTDLYTHFMNPATMHNPGGGWNFKETLPLQSPEFGALMVDIMKDGSIGGIEFLDRVMGHPVDLDTWMNGLAAVSAAVVKY